MGDERQEWLAAEAAPKERFSQRSEAYRRYRPGYPPELIAKLLAAAQAAARTADAARGGRDDGATRAGPVVADLGSGTGISARPLLEAGCVVYGVEPNAAMRQAGEAWLAGFPHYRSVAASAEATTLAPASVHLIMAAQALHWFPLAATRREMARIAAPGAQLAIFWNTRDGGASPFMAGYESMVGRHSSDFKAVFHGNVAPTEIEALFDEPPQALVFPWSEALALDAVVGRTQSSSYMPGEGAAFDAVLEELTALVAAHGRDGQVEMHYRCELWLGAAPQA